MPKPSYAGIPHRTQNQLVSAMDGGITQAPECMAFTTARMGLVVVRAMQQGQLITADTLATATLEPPYLDDLVERTVTKHAQVMAHGLEAPSINNANLPRLLPMFYRFGMHGVLRTAAILASDRTEAHTQLGDATAEEIVRARSYLESRETRTRFMDMLDAMRGAFRSQDVRWITDDYVAALKGETRPPHFPQPLTAAMRHDRDVSFGHTRDVLQTALVAATRPLVEEQVLAVPGQTLPPDTIRAAIGTLMLP